MPSSLTLLHCTVTNLLITHSFFLWHSVKKDPSALLSICWLGLVISPLMVFTSYGFNVCVISFGSSLGNLISCTGKKKLRGLKLKLQADMMGSVERNWNESVLLRDRDSSKMRLIMNEVDFIVMRLGRGILTSPSPNMAIKYLNNKWWIMQNVTFLASGFIKSYNWICTQRLRLSSFIKKKDVLVFLEEDEKKSLLWLSAQSVFGPEIANQSISINNTAAWVLNDIVCSGVTRKNEFLRGRKISPAHRKVFTKARFGTALCTKI